MSQQINLFNPVFMNQRKYFSTVAMLQGLALIMLGSALFYGYAAYHVKSMTAEVNEISKRYRNEQTQLQHYTEEFSPEKARLELQKELSSTEARLAAQNELVETLKSGAIGNATGYSEYLRAFARQKVNGLWLTRLSLSGDATQMSIKGAVLSPELLPLYIRKLNQEPALQGKSFAALQMAREEDNGRYVVFTLQSIESGKAGQK